MIRTVKCGGVLEYQANVGNKFICVVIARSVFVEIRFGGMRCNEFAIYCGKVHRGLDNGWVMGDVESHNVDRSLKRAGVFQLFQ